MNNNKITCQDIRDAIIDCFAAAHCADTGLTSDKSSGDQYCLLIVKKAFSDQGVDFDNPTKQGIVKVLDSLAEFSKAFRSQDIIQKHQQEILDLLDKVK